MWVTKLLISPVKKVFFAQKRPNFARIWHFSPLLAHLVPCWWVVGGFGARAVSRKTPIYFIYLYIFTRVKRVCQSIYIYMYLYILF